MEIQMNVPYAIEILSNSPLFKTFPLKEKIKLARQYCDQWGTPIIEKEKKKKSN